MQRSQPLMDLDPFISKSQQDFEANWNRVKGLQQDLSMSTDKAEDGTYFCQACMKSFAKETVYLGHKKGKKHIKAMESQSTFKIDILLLEHKIFDLASKQLQETISNTKIHIEKKIARNSNEEEEEDELEQEIVKKVEEDDTEEIQVSKANYPVGWDGKPIPYWLYKLHGLGVEYKCEICGNASYFGRKAYEMHFQEWRHAHGMKCLGIPNNLIFRDITKINDALILWEKIKRDSTSKEWKPETEEEFEDKEGNVYNKKIFLDLKRQGLL